MHGDAKRGSRRIQAVMGPHAPARLRLVRLNQIHPRNSLGELMQARQSTAAHAKRAASRPPRIIIAVPERPPVHIDRRPLRVFLF